MVLLACVLLVAPCRRLSAQETRGSIVGKVTDQSGAVFPGTAVSVTNKAMGTKTSPMTNDQGFYQATYLLSGLYRIEVEVAGFKKFVRDDVEVRINDRIEINIMLEIGELTQTVSVTGETPLLSNTSASLGQVVDSRRIVELPLAHGNPYQLIGLSGGITFNRDPRLDRPYEPTHIVGYTIDGSRANRSDLTIDGAASTATANNFEVIATYTPPGDVIQEFKVQTATFDASFGSTEGGVTNISIKSGTNNLHGTAYYSGLPPWTANDFYANRVGQPIAEFKENRWGGSAGGPLIIPGLYNGRNRTFWLFGYEGIHDSRPRNNSTSSTVPTAKMKSGDFSELLAINPSYQIYNPFDATFNSTTGRITRAKFDGNIIPPSLINPLGKKILSMWPDPRFTPSSADGTNNNYDASLTEQAKYYTWTFRVDHSISDRQRLFVRGSAYTRNSTYNNYLANTLLSGNFFSFFARNGVIDHVYTMNPTTVLNIKFGYSRFIRGDSADPSTIGFDLSSLGFPASYNDAIPKEIRRFPAISMSGYQGTSGAGEWRPVEVYSLPVTLNKSLGRHFLKTGMEFRAYREVTMSFQQNQTGQFNFDTTYTRGPLDNSAGSPNGYGQSVAALLLGLPTNTSLVRRAASFAEQSTSYGFFLQDDWKASGKLTLNLGLRWEFETPLTERFNRSVRGFDYTAAQPISAAVQANYAKNPTPEVPVDQFKIQGGLTFAGVNGQPRGLYDTSKKNIMPRFGFAYQLSDKTVVRGGYGIFFGFLGERRGDVIQTGFTRDTTFIPTNDGITFINTLSNPFPNGILNPLGSSLGTQTYLGQALTYALQGQSLAFFNPKPKTAYAQRWQLSIQREFGGGVIAEAAYVGNRGTHIEITRNLNVTPQRYLSTSPVRDQKTIDYLTFQMPSPFYGVTLPAGATSTFTSNKIARERLLRPFPQFDTVNATFNDGYSWYHAMQLRLEKRFSKGYSVMLNYGWSKNMQATELLNQDDPRPYETISDYDNPHRLTISALLEFPFGDGHRLLSTGNPVVNRIVGGWQLSPIYTFQSGAPVGFGNVLYYGNFSDLALPSDQRSVTRWFNTAGFETATAKQLDHNVRTFPLRFSSIRANAMSELGLSLLKNTRISEETRIQFKAEALNALNHPVLSAPNTTPTSSSFGSTVSANQVNYARRIQLSVKFIF
jgi:hypothetical protein